MLEKNFKQDLSDIYQELGNFREGLKSLEVYTQQTST